MNSNQTEILAQNPLPALNKHFPLDYPRTGAHGYDYLAERHLDYVKNIEGLEKIAKKELQTKLNGTKPSILNLVATNSIATTLYGLGYAIQEPSMANFLDGIIDGGLLLGTTLAITAPSTYKKTNTELQIAQVADQELVDIAAKAHTAYTLAKPLNSMKKNISQGILGTALATGLSYAIEWASQAQFIPEIDMNNTNIGLTTAGMFALSSVYEFCTKKRLQHKLIDTEKAKYYFKYTPGVITKQK